MDRIQIQLPPKLRADIQAIADYNEWSFAETMRRFAEKGREEHKASIGADKSKPWTLPIGRPLKMRENIDWEAVRDDMYTRPLDTSNQADR